MYDLHFVLPIAPTIPKYNTRLADMKKFGIINVGLVKVLVTLLVEESYKEWQSLKQGWAPGIDVEYVKVPSTNVEHKYAHFYLHRFISSWNRATWTVRVDDDSATDVEALMYRLQEFDPSDPLHLVAWETTVNLRDRHKKLYKTFGFTDESMRNFQHTWEVCVDSYAACERFVQNPEVRRMFTIIRGWGLEEQPWADASYCYGMRMCKVFPCHVDFLSKDANVRNFSFTGGRFTHIHEVARDHDKGKWAYFVNSMEEVFNGV